MEGTCPGILILLGLLLRAATGSDENVELGLESFALFGHVQIHPKNFSRELCAAHVSVYLDDQEWKRELTEEFYVFRVSLNRYMGRPGLIHVTLVKDMQETTLWRSVFIVDESGGYQADAVLRLPSYLNCSPTTDDRKASEVAGHLAQVTASTSFQEPEVCLPLQLETCASQGSETPVVFDEAEEQEGTDIEEGDEGCYMVFGSPRLRNWQLAVLLLTGTFLHLQVLVLQGFISSTLGGSAPSDLCYSEHPAAGWELCTLTPASRKGCRARSSLVATGTGCFNKAWSEAEQLLWKCDEACFSYNCSSGKRKKSWGKWNRDAFGRLIRS